MAANTRIEWAHHTFNPWVGCTKVSAACDHCYAESWAKRAGTPELWQGARRRTSAANWRQPLKWNRIAAEAGERHRVFCASLADWLDNRVPDSWRDDLANLIEATPNLDWLLLTKRKIQEDQNEQDTLHLSRQLRRRLRRGMGRSRCDRRAPRRVSCRRLPGSAP